MAIPLRAETATKTDNKSRAAVSAGSAVTVEDLVARLDQAVRLQDPVRITGRVQEELEIVLGSGGLLLEPRFRRPHPERYARRLLHRSEELDYTAVVMTWGPGQETPLHDHGGSWCVEGVVEGRIRVTRYELLGPGPKPDAQQDLYRFLRRGTLEAGVGEAGSLIPPLEHHVLGNADGGDADGGGVAVTLHVYQGEMARCTTFEPVNRDPSVQPWQGQEALYRSRQRLLGYDD